MLAILFLPIIIIIELLEIIPRIIRREWSGFKYYYNRSKTRNKKD